VGLRAILRAALRSERWLRRKAALSARARVKVVTGYLSCRAAIIRHGGKSEGADGSSMSRRGPGRDGAAAQQGGLHESKAAPVEALRGARRMVAEAGNPGQRGGAVDPRDPAQPQGHATRPTTAAWPRSRMVARTISCSSPRPTNKVTRRRRGAVYGRV